MTEYTELKPLLDACRAENCDGPREFRKAVEALFDVCTAETISALIAENERLQESHEQICTNYNQVSYASEERGKQIDQLKAELEHTGYDHDLLRNERDQLKAENEALRKERDACHPFKPFHEPAIGFTGCVICGVYTDHGGLPCPKTRATADAAMGKGDRP